MRGGAVSGLRSLEATHNQLHTLPDDLGLLTRLELLYLRHNRLTHMPLLEHCTALKVSLQGGVASLSVHLSTACI